MKDYHINIFYSDEEEALRAVKVARKTWIEAARAEGKPVPSPTYRPLIYQM